MRWPVVRTLVHKEARRLAGNRGALVLAALLVASAGLLTAFERGGLVTPGATRPLGRFWVDYWRPGPWVEHLRANIPDELDGQIRFRAEPDIPRDRTGALQYGPGEGSVQLRPIDDGLADHWKVWFWQAGSDPAALAPFEEWFWSETRRFFHEQAVRALPADRQDEARRVPPPPPSYDPARLAAELDRLYRERLAAIAAPDSRPELPEFEVERSALRAIELRRAAATALVLFAIFFACAYVQSSLTCEERERGVLLAQALSPATAGDILVAKALVFGGCGIGLAALLAGICQPAVLFEPFFWLALAAAAAGSLGLGLTIASLARTQRAASVGSLAYTLAIALIVFVGAQVDLRFVPLLIIEYHLPRMLQAALDGSVQVGHWLHLAATGGLAAGWVCLAAFLFRRRGWQ
jgi:ABC-2 type transporter